MCVPPSNVSVKISTKLLMEMVDRHTSTYGKPGGLGWKVQSYLLFIEDGFSTVSYPFYYQRPFLDNGGIQIFDTLLCL